MWLEWTGRGHQSRPFDLVAGEDLRRGDLVTFKRQPMGLHVAGVYRRLRRGGERVMGVVAGDCPRGRRPRVEAGGCRWVRNARPVTT